SHDRCRRRRDACGLPGRHRGLPELPRGRVDESGDRPPGGRRSARPGRRAGRGARAGGGVRRRDLPGPLRRRVRRRRPRLDRRLGGPDGRGGGRVMSFTWKSALEKLAEHRRLAEALGGLERVRRHHDQGRQTIRERIEAIAETFTEVGEFAGFGVRDASGAEVGRLSSSYVCGLATIDGRQVALGGEDFTVRAGAPQTYLDRYKGGMGGFVEDLAHSYRIPLVMFMEGIGGDVSAQDEVGHSYLVSSMSWKRSLDLLGEVPVLVGVLGSAAGGTAGRAVLSHFSVISSGSVMFAGGPPVVRRALGQDVDKHELGGAEMHTSVSGAIDNLVADEDEAIRQMRAVLSYLPRNAWELPPRGDRYDPVDRSCDAILEIIPENRRRPYKMRDAMAEVVDRDSFFRWGRIGAARLSPHSRGSTVSR